MEQLLAIQGALKVPKNQMNEFGGYKYRSCEDILEALKPILQAFDCQLTISDDIVAVGSRIYVKATVTLTNSEGVSVSTTAFAREEEAKKGMDASQITGAASSYARKYALGGMFCIDDTKDADATNDGGQTQQQQTKPAQQQQKQPPKVVPIDKLREMALEELGKADTSTEVAAVWRKYPSLAEDKTFHEFVVEKGKTLKEKEAYEAKTKQRLL